MIKTMRLQIMRSHVEELRTPLWIRLVLIKTDGSVRYVSNGNTFNQEALPIRLNIQMSRCYWSTSLRIVRCLVKCLRDRAARSRSLYSLYKNNKLRRDVALIFLDTPARRSDAAVNTPNSWSSPASDEFLLPHATKSIYPYNMLGF